MSDQKMIFTAQRCQNVFFNLSSQNTYFSLVLISQYFGVNDSQWWVDLSMMIQPRYLIESDIAFSLEVDMIESSLGNTG